VNPWRALWLHPEPPVGPPAPRLERIGLAVE
jgi:hypothetical protein